MHALSYELRRLRGLRSTWSTAVLVLAADLAVALTATGSVPAGSATTSPDGTAAVVLASAGVVPFLPLPVAAVGAGLFGVLAYAQEARYPGLPASRVSFRRRAGLLAAKAVVTGGVGAALAVATLLLGGIVVGLLDPAAAPRPDELAGRCAAYGALVVCAGWAGLLAAALVRRALPGLLVFLALFAAVEPVTGLLLRRAGRAWPRGVGELLPFRGLLDGVPAARFAPAVPDGQLLALALAPVALLAVAALLVQFRRRAL